MKQHTYSFYSFDSLSSGQVVTENDHSVVVFARNPYGSHNLVVVDKDSHKAYRHGNLASLLELKGLWQKKPYRRARRFLAKKGTMLELALEAI